MNLTIVVADVRRRRCRWCKEIRLLTPAATVLGAKARIWVGRILTPASAKRFVEQTQSLLWMTVPPLQGLRFCWTMNPGFHPGLSSGGLAALWIRVNSCLSVVEPHPSRTSTRGVAPGYRL